MKLTNFKRYLCFKEPSSIINIYTFKDMIYQIWSLWGAMWGADWIKFIQQHLMLLWFWMCELILNQMKSLCYKYSLVKTLKIKVLIKLSWIKIITVTIGSFVSSICIIMFIIIHNKLSLGITPSKNNIYSQLKL